ncbi:MAG: hypothetical protein R3F49_00955 [Planctomycetota bacterium]
MPSTRLFGLVVVGGGLFAADHWIIGSIRRVAYDMGLLLPAYVALAVAFAAWYLLLLRALLAWDGEGRRARALLCVGGGLVALWQLAGPLSGPPKGSIDALTYVVHGHCQVAEGQNPYFVRPDSALDGPLAAQLGDLGYHRAHDRPSPYGPLWSLIEAAIWWGTGEVRSALRAFQALGLLALGLSTWLLVWLARARDAAPHGERAAGRERSAGERPHGSGLAPFAVGMAFLWNPVVMLESAGDAHLDAVAYALVLVALARAHAAPRSWSWAFALALAVNVKATFGLFGPSLCVVAAAGLGARGVVRAAVGGGAVLGLVTLALYWPYWRGPATLDALWRHSEADGWARLCVAGALALAVGLAWRELRRPTGNVATATAAPSLLLGGAYWFPWYAQTAIGELLRLRCSGGRTCGALVTLAVALTLVGRLATGTYFTFIQHYEPRWGWPDALLLPTGLYRAAGGLLGVLALVSLGASLRSRLSVRRDA